MQFIANTFSMAKRLVDLGEDVVSISAKDNVLTLIGANKTVSLNCEIQGHGEIKQANIRWDWVKDLMRQVNEQPVTFSVTEETLNITFSY